MNLSQCREGQELPESRGGDFTIFKFVASLDRHELERRMGFHPGRLGLGAVIAVMSAESLAVLTTSDFSLGASTRWSRSRASAPWMPEFAFEIRDGKRVMAPNAIESKLALEDRSIEALRSKVLAFMRTRGENHPAKVFPLWKHDKSLAYPDADVGAPQFRLHRKVKWTVVRVVGTAPR